MASGQLSVCRIARTDLSSVFDLGAEERGGVSRVLARILVSAQAFGHLSNLIEIAVCEYWGQTRHPVSCVCRGYLASRPLRLLHRIGAHDYLHMSA